MMSPNDEHSFHGGETTDQTMIMYPSIPLIVAYLSIIHW